MDSRLEELKRVLESAVQGMSQEQLIWHPASKWSAAEVLEHLYLTYTGTIRGFERVIQAGKPLATRGSVRQRFRSLVVTGFGYLPTGRKAPPPTQPRGLPTLKVRNEIGEKIGVNGRDHHAMRSPLRKQHPLARPSDSRTVDCDAVAEVSSAARTPSPEADSWLA